MKTILQINSSIHGPEGASSRLADALVARLRRREPAARLRVRDLAADAIPHLDAKRFAAFLARPEARDADDASAAACSDTLIEELRQADTLVLGLPMYNFGVPSQLKAWMDHVARAGETFRYTERGPVGLLEG
ncbi:MAG: NAD(P)H-dependent oxidoreductase, partial [Gammaproteobacteria bacterium]|nr:NAD(P)H-dependent oxidoreductase [Gammaproteobacteria bacterium]